MVIGQAQRIEKVGKMLIAGHNTDEIIKATGIADIRLFFKRNADYFKDIKFVKRKVANDGQTLGRTKELL